VVVRMASVSSRAPSWKAIPRLGLLAPGPRRLRDDQRGSSDPSMSAIRSRRFGRLAPVELRVCTLATPRGRLWAVGTARAVEERVDCASCPTLARLHEVRAPDNAGPALLPPPRSVPRVPNLLERHPEVREVLGSRLLKQMDFREERPNVFLVFGNFTCGLPSTLFLT
jgi:hypothetical protein